MQIHLHYNTTNCAAATCYCCCPSHQRMDTDVCGGLNVYSVESKHRYSCSGLLTHESGWSFVGQTTRNSHIIKCTLDSTLFAWQINDYWLYKSCVHNVMVPPLGSAEKLQCFLAWSCGRVLPGYQVTIINKQLQFSRHHVYFV